MKYFWKLWAYVSGCSCSWGDACTNGQGICVQKFRNAYQRKELEKWLTHLKSTLPLSASKWFSEIMFLGNNVCYPFTTLACLPWSFALCVVLDVLIPSTFCVYAVCSIPIMLCTARFLCIVHTEICVHVTAVYQRHFQWGESCMEMTGLFLFFCRCHWSVWSSWFWMKRIGCWTWVSSQKFVRLWKQWGCQTKWSDIHWCSVQLSQKRFKDLLETFSTIISSWLLEELGEQLQTLRRASWKLQSLRSVKSLQKFWAMQVTPMCTSFLLQVSTTVVHHRLTYWEVSWIITGLVLVSRIDSSNLFFTRRLYFMVFFSRNGPHPGVCRIQAWCRFPGSTSFWWRLPNNQHSWVSFWSALHSVGQNRWPIFSAKWWLALGYEARPLIPYSTHWLAEDKPVPGLVNEPAGLMLG